MKRSLLGLVVVAVIVVGVVVGTNGRTSPRDTPPQFSYTIEVTPAKMAALKAAYLAFKLHNKEIVSTDRITWGRVIEPSGPNRPVIAYDAVDHRDWAIASFNLVLPASYKAEV